MYSSRAHPSKKKLNIDHDAFGTIASLSKLWMKNVQVVPNAAIRTAVLSSHRLVGRCAGKFPIVLTRNHMVWK
jgi:hypothetical protein